MNLLKSSIGISLIAVLFSCNQSNNQSISDTHRTEYHKLFTQASEQGQFNGNVLVCEDGKIVYQGAFGLRNLNGDSLDLNSVFRLASVSKQFTAMAIMKLQEEGKLNYQQDITDFIPDLPYDAITIRDLLNHTSGLPDYVSLMDQKWNPELNDDDPEKMISSHKDIVNMLIQEAPPIHFKPGEDWEYSNTGYVLLASIVRIASGIPFEQYLHEEIFAPLEMDQTCVYDYVLEEDPSMPNRVFGFREALISHELVPNDCHYLNRAQGDGGIYSTLEDLYKWDRALYSEKLVSQETLEEAYASAVLANGDSTHYGFGWGIGESDEGKKQVYHSGGWVGFGTYIFRELDSNSSFIMLTNNSGDYLGEIVNEVTNILHKKSYKIPAISISEVLKNGIKTEGIEGAIGSYYEAKNDTGSNYNFHESQVNSLGYAYLQEDQVEEALALFKLNVDEYPESANVYDSYGDGLLARGDTLKAIENFQRAYSLDSSFKFSLDKAQDLIK